MTAFIVPTDSPVRRAAQMARDVQAGGYYLFAGDHRPTTNSDLPQLSRSASDAYYGPWRQMIFGVATKQALPCIRANPYSFGTVFPQWDDRVDMSTIVPWYAVVNSGSFSHVFGCLYNNGGKPSTIQPDFSQVVGANSVLYQTSDGYRWKYMYSVDAGTVSTYADGTWFPLVPNTSVTSAAVPGSIDVVSVNDGGKLYNNYTSGTFQASDVRVGGTPTIYQLSNSTISSANGFYEGCVLMITGGVGTGQYARILSYASSNNGNFVTLDRAFPVSPTNGSTFVVNPSVILTSDTTETVPCVAMALVNAVATNSVSTIQILNPGAGYFSPTTANVYATQVVGVGLQANVYPIMPPPGGHGADVSRELGATTVMVSCTLANTIGGRIPAVNTYRNVGLLRTPVFANVHLTVSPADGAYLTNEPVSFLTLKTVEVGCTVDPTTPVIVSNSALFMSSVAPGQDIYVSNGTAQFIGTVQSVQNSTAVTLTSNSSFASANATVSIPTYVANGTVLQPNTQTDVWVTGITSPFSIGNVMLGRQSLVATTVTQIARNDFVGDFSAYVQLYKYRATMLGGAFIQNEYVLQGNNSGLVHSYANGYLLVSNQTRPFNLVSNLTGNTSGAIAVPTVAYSPELVQGSGTLEYLENVTTVTRQPNESEQWMVAYSF